MIRLNYARENAVAELRAHVTANLEKYRKPQPFLPSFFRKDGEWLCESSVEIASFPKLNPGRDGKADTESAIALHKALFNLTESQASDERLWVWLAHDPYWTYMRTRWPAEGQKESYIYEHYFIGHNVRHLVRHGIARLWWFAHITYDNTRADPYELTRAMLEYDSDHRQNLMETDFVRNREFIKSVLTRTLYWTKKGKKILGNRARFRALCKELNLHGGTLLLDCLSPEDIFSLIDDFMMQLPADVKEEEAEPVI